MPMSTYMKNKVLDHFCNDGTYTPTNLYLALFNGDPSGAGSEILSAGSGGYARQEITGAEWDAASAGTKTNNAVQTFGPFSSNPANADYAALYDAATAGNLMWYGTLSVAKDAAIGDSISFAVGEIDLTIT